MGDICHSLHTNFITPHQSSPIFIPEPTEEKCQVEKCHFALNNFTLSFITPWAGAGCGAVGAEPAPGKSRSPLRNRWCAPKRPSLVHMLTFLCNTDVTRGVNSKKYKSCPIKSHPISVALPLYGRHTKRKLWRKLNFSHTTL